MDKNVNKDILSGRTLIVKDLSECNSRLEEELRERTYKLMVANEKLRYMSLKLSETEGLERKRLVRELRDQIDQALSALTINLNVIKKKMPNAPEIVSSCLDNSLSLLEDITERVRTIMSDLRPPLPDGHLAEQGPGDETLSLSRLSRREREILRLVVEGKTSRKIAEQLYLSPKTVETYRSRMMKKLEIRDIPGLVRFAIRQGMISAE